MGRVLNVGKFAVQVSIGSSAHLFSALGIDNSWSHQKFKRDLRVAMKWVKGDDMEFDIIGIDPAIANALRRILIAEIPTVAIEHVFMVQNTSIIAVRPPCFPAAHDPERQLLTLPMMIILKTAAS